MPACQIFALVQKMFIIFPDPYVRWGRLHIWGQPFGRVPYLGQPLVGRVVSLGLVQPVPVENGEVDFALEPFMHRRKRWQGWSQAMFLVLVVATAKLETKIKEPLRV